MKEIASASVYESRAENDVCESPPSQNRPKIRKMEGEEAVYEGEELVSVPCRAGVCDQQKWF